MEICSLNAGNKNGAAIPNASRQKYKINFVNYFKFKKLNKNSLNE